MRQPDARPTPFVQETQEFVDDCLERFFLMHGTLNHEIGRADQEALHLIRTGLPEAILAAQRAGHEMLALHFADLLAQVPSEDALDWLLNLAVDGRQGSMTLIGEIIERIVAQVGAHRQPLG